LAHEFIYKGGVVKPTTHTVEKFLLFFVIDGKEVPLHQLRRDGLVQQAQEGGDRFLTGLTVGKIFLAQQGFGIARRYHSFYFRFVDGPSEMVTIRGYGGDKVGLVMKAKVRFLNRSQVLDLLHPENESRPFVERQAAMPLDVLRQLVTVERVKIEDVRHVRIGRKRGHHEPITGLPMSEE